VEHADPAVRRDDAQGLGLVPGGRAAQLVPRAAAVALLKTRPALVVMATSLAPPTASAGPLKPRTGRKLSGTSRLLPMSSKLHFLRCGSAWPGGAGCNQRPCTKGAAALRPGARARTTCTASSATPPTTVATPAWRWALGSVARSLLCHRAPTPRWVRAHIRCLCF
jgi:hypothetical protein